MRSLLALAAAAAVPTTPFYDGMPPARFEGPARLDVAFGRVEECGKPNMPDHPNAVFAACVRDGVTYLPDPCAYPEETFARLACHEIAHVRGWPKDHGE